MFKKQFYPNLTEILLDDDVEFKYQIKKILFILYFIFLETYMRLTRAGEYAVRCVLYLAAQRPGVVCNRKEIAKAMDIPDQFLGKIAQQLAHAGLIEIVQGSRGGLLLIIEPDKVSLLDVVEAVIGKIFLNDCIFRQDSCNRQNTCAAHFVWEKAKNQLRATLREATFASLLQNDGCFNPFEMEKDISDQA